MSLFGASRSTVHLVVVVIIVPSIAVMVIQRIQDMIQAVIIIKMEHALGVIQRQIIAVMDVKTRTIRSIVQTGNT